MLNKKQNDEIKSYLSQIFNNNEEEEKIINSLNENSQYLNKKTMKTFNGLKIRIIDFYIGFFKSAVLSKNYGDDEYFQEHKETININILDHLKQIKKYNENNDDFSDNEDDEDYIDFGYFLAIQKLR
jgi:hypothetical protein